MKFTYTLFLAVFCTFINISSGISQTKYPQNYFRNPLDIPIALAGSFGEMRPNHFHSGIDIKTNSVEGLNVYAVAEGYVSRIRVQAHGFGNAVYITHPNGFVTVYGHLKKYHPNIAQYLKAVQYEKESFEVDIFPLPNELPVKKGDIIAYSGNTGSSGGPHLHFEIRDAKTEETINPSLFGYEIEDHVPPIIQSIKIYALNNKGSVNDLNASIGIAVKGKAGKYNLIKANPIKVHGNIGFGVVTFDSQTSAMEKNGVFSIEMKLDDKRFYYHEIDRFSFSETKAINSHIDYEERMKGKAFIQKCCIDPNNQLSIYKDVTNRGILNFNDNLTHKIEYIIKDVKGNQSNLEFQVQSSSVAPPILSSCKSPECNAILPSGKDNIFKTTDLIVEISKESLYDTLFFKYLKTPKTSGLYSSVHHIHDRFTPVNGFQISIKPEDLPENLKSKALVVSVSGNSKASAGGSFEKGMVTTKAKTFGNYAVAVDTIPPTIVPINITPGKNMSKNSAIQFKIHDNLSGVKSYRGTIDGKWILMEFDGKSSLLYFTFDASVGSGQHELILKVTDQKDNVKEFKCDFSR